MASKSANKTVATTESVEAVLAALPEPRQADCRQLAQLMQTATGQPAVMWGRMVGFGHYHYRYESGREGDIFEIGFAPGKAEISVYTNCGNADRTVLLARLGKHRMGGSCLYLKRLADVDTAVLTELLAQAVVEVRSRAAA
jgi:hypothetical protein